MICSRAKCLLCAATGFSVQESHAVVLDPNNQKVIVARISPDEWGRIAAMQAKR